MTLQLIQTHTFYESKLKTTQTISQIWWCDAAELHIWQKPPVTQIEWHSWILQRRSAIASLEHWQQVACCSRNACCAFCSRKTPPRRVNNQSWWFWKFAKMYENINWYLIAECPLQQRRPLARNRRCWWKRGTLPPAQRREKWPWKPTKQGWRGRALKTCPGVAGLLRLLSQATDVEVF